MKSESITATQSIICSTDCIHTLPQIPFIAKGVLDPELHLALHIAFNCHVSSVSLKLKSLRMSSVIHDTSTVESISQVLCKPSLPLGFVRRLLVVFSKLCVFGRNIQKGCRVPPSWGIMSGGQIMIV